MGPGTSSSCGLSSQRLLASIVSLTINDADTGGLSDTSTDENALCLWSAVQPACHLVQLACSLQLEAIQWPEGDTIVSSGEDWLDAYRYTPMGPEESRGCVVVYWHHLNQRPVFQ
eukprot:4549712-Karenia_brevis.AAC.1